MKKTLLFVIIMVLVSVVVFSACDHGAEEIDWVNIRLGYILPQPQSNLMEIISNDDNNLLVYVHNISQNDYLEYQRWCETDKGFNIDAEMTGNSFYGYNQDGYSLSLYYDESQNEMSISLSAGLELGLLVWSRSEMAQMLPIPVSTIGIIQQDNEKGFSAYVGDTSIDAFNSYVVACKEKGFTIGENTSTKHFSARNEEGYKLSVDYRGNNVICISISEPEYDITIDIECVENWVFSTYDVDVYIDDMLEGTIPHGDNETYSLVLTKGMHKLVFESADDDTLDGEIHLEITKSENFKFKISCTSLGIDIETLQGTTSLPDDDQGGQNSNPSTSKIVITLNDEDFKGMNYQEAEQKFREMGFTKFEYRTVDTENKAATDTICYIEITEWLFGDTSFVKGDIFDVNSTVTFFSYKYKEPTASSPVFYSTNDYETAQKGNTGVFSYRNRGASYDIYWIIDFDEGYVYYFTDGNGDSSCDRLKIDSGTLNDAIIITYHDGGDTWSYRLHFKYVNSPVTLIMVDQNGFDWEYSTTDLDDALALRNSKIINDY